MSEKKSNSQKNNSDSSAAATQAAADAADVKQKLFILKAKEKNLKNAEHFLNNRNFEIVSTTDMKVAINTILSGHASYIMLSADHANPKVMKLPAIIQASFNTPIIIFSEGLSPKGVAALRESRHPYVLYPPVSGPAVERMILKIERDRKEKAESLELAKSQAENNEGNESGTMKFSSLSQGEQDDVVMQSKKAQQEFEKIFTGETEDDADSTIASLDEGSDDDQGMSFAQSQILQHGERGHDQPDDAEAVISYLNQEGKADASGPSYSGGPAGGHRRNMRTGMASEDGTGVNTRNDFTSFSYTSGGVAPTPEGFDSNNLSETGERSEDGSSELGSQGGGIGLPKFVGQNKKGDMYIGPQKDNASIENNSQFNQAGATKNNLPNGSETPPGELTAAEILAKKNVNLLTFKSDDNSSFLIMGSKHALESSANFVQGKKVSKLQTCTKVACFNLDSSQFSGYVIVAFGEKDKIDEQFNKNIQNYLVEYMKLNGLEVKTADLKALKIKEVNFEEWSIREADFLMTSIHEGNEIALAFFPHDKKEAPLELSAQANMAKMTIDEIKADEPVEFDIYIYLPSNEKYVRYTPQNGIMYANQKDRLTKGGHAKIHIRKESESDLSRYRVQNFLNDKIESFKRSKKAVSSN